MTLVHSHLGYYVKCCKTYTQIKSTLNIMYCTLIIQIFLLLNLSNILNTQKTKLDFVYYFNQYISKV